MADIVAGEAYVARQARPTNEPLAQRILTLVIIVLSLVLAGELVYHLLLAPRLVISEITIESDAPLGEQEILSIAGVGEGTPYFSVDAADAVARLEAHPVVRQATVDTVFPNRVEVFVARRRALAAAIAVTEAGTIPLVFDEEGVVFRLGLGEAEQELPIVSGLRFEEVAVGLTLPRLLVDFLAQLREIKMNDPALYRLFSEYRVVQKNAYAFEVVLYPMHYQVPVRIGTSITADMIQYVMMTLDVLHSEGRLSSLVELDFRSGEGVLRTVKEAGDA
ncbi:MAG: cell division protein FtsQ/DivIB [Spirochaetota bacterium]